MLIGGPGTRAGRRRLRAHASALAPAATVLALSTTLAVATTASALPLLMAPVLLAAALAERRRGQGEAAAQAARFRGLVETMDDVVFHVGGDGRWAYLNPAWERLSGERVAESLGRPWLERMVPDDAAAVTRGIAPVLAGRDRSFRHTIRFRGADGVRWVELVLQSMPGAGGASGTLRDVDERKRSEEHVLAARYHAEQRAREATMLASTDELTGIANRRAFLQQLDREIAAAVEYGWPLAVALFDVDHFKAVNDRHGHGVGDRVLQCITDRAVRSVRGGDLVGRIGGEEFAILMPGAGAQEATIVAERLRRAVQGAAAGSSTLPPVTVSIGIAEREDQRSAEAMLAAADAALYLAKDDGRNRVRIAA